MGGETTGHGELGKRRWKTRTGGVGNHPTRGPLPSNFAAVVAPKIGCARTPFHFADLAVTSFADTRRHLQHLAPVDPEVILLLGLL